MAFGYILKPGSNAPAMPQAVPSGLARTYTQDFNTPAALGSFNTNYGPTSGQTFKLGNYDLPTGNTSTNGITIYDSNRCSYVANGSYFCNMHSESGQSYASTVLPLDPANGSPAQNSYLNFTYGQVGFSVRLADYFVDSTSGSTGYKIAFLMWPQTGLWTSEIDFPETDSFSGTTTFDVQEPIRAASMANSTQRGGATGTFIANYDTGVHLTDGLYHTFLLDWPPAVTITYATNDVFTFPSAHGLVVNDIIDFAYGTVTGSPGFADGSGNPANFYYVQSTPSSNTLTIATTQSAATPLNVTVAGSCQYVPHMTASIDGTVVQTWNKEITIPQQAMHFAIQCEGWIKPATGTKLPPPTTGRALIEVPWVYVNTVSSGAGALTTTTTRTTSTTLTTGA